jgi:Na+-transporting NADH:ubiquinone oxidoreductase subunit D
MDKKPKLSSYFFDPLWNNNQILIAILGICSALAVTVKIPVALTMALAVSFVTGCSSFLVSLIRKQTPDSVRMIAQLAIISLFVILVDQLLRAYLFEMSKTLSVFVGLIITNCIVMGRAESMAKNVPPLPAFLDGLSAGFGYGAILIAVAAIRELFGFGTLFNLPVMPSSFVPFGLMPLAPAAFFILGGFIWITKTLKKRP